MRSSQSEPKNVLFGMRTGPFSLRPWDYLTVTPPHPPFPSDSVNPSHPCKQGSIHSCGPCLWYTPTRYFVFRYLPSHPPPLRHVCVRIGCR